MGEEEEITDQAIEAAEHFTTLYYKSVDSERHNMGKFYLDTATLIWNGNMREGDGNISKFFLDQVPTSSHNISCLDCQPVADAVVAGQKTIMILVTGTVKYRDKPASRFEQTFLLTANKDRKWKIASDTFRSHKD